jgi:hypothetical protein
VPFDLRNAPAAFKQLMKLVLKDLKKPTWHAWMTALVSTGLSRNSLPTCGRCSERPAPNSNLIGANIFRKIRCLGHISSEGSTADPEKLKAEQSWAPPWDNPS